MSTYTTAEAFSENQRIAFRAKWLRVPSPNDPADTCLAWTGWTDKKGRPWVCVWMGRPRNWRAHRIQLALHRIDHGLGPFDEETETTWTCGTLGCGNVEHMVLGTTGHHAVDQWARVREQQAAEAAQEAQETEAGAGEAGAAVEPDDAA